MLLKAPSAPAPGCLELPRRSHGLRPPQTMLCSSPVELASDSTRLGERCCTVAFASCLVASRGRLGPYLCDGTERCSRMLCRQASRSRQAPLLLHGACGRPSMQVAQWDMKIHCGCSVINRDVARLHVQLLQGSKPAYCCKRLWDRAQHDTGVGPPGGGRGDRRYFGIQWDTARCSGTHIASCAGTVFAALAAARTSTKCCPVFTSFASRLILLLQSGNSCPSATQLLTL